MTGGNERDQRPETAGEAKASPLNRVLDSDAFLLLVLAGLGVLNFGWVMYPALGKARDMVNGAAIIGIVGAVIIMAMVRRRGKP